MSFARGTIAGARPAGTGAGSPPGGPGPLRVLHLTAGSDAGGISRYLKDLCDALHGDGHHVAVAGARGASHGLFEGTLWPWIELPMDGGPASLWAAIRGLRRWVRQHPPDLVHTHYRRSTFVARVLSRACAEARVPVLHTLHLSDLSRSWPRALYNDFGDHTHVAAEEAQAWLVERRGVLADRVTLVHHGVRPDTFPVSTSEVRAAARRALGLAGDDVVAAYVGRLDAPKNEQWVLDVAVACRAQGVPMRLVIAGDGPHRAAVEARIGAEGLDDAVRLLGYRDPLVAYQASDLFLLPSAREGFSLACVEAMATGLPVLRTRTAGAAAQIVEGVTGRSVPVDRTRFVAAAVELLRDPRRLPAMGRAAAEHVRARFSFDEQVARTIDLYRRVATLRPAGT